MRQAFPVQQSAVLVQVEPWGWQATGAWQVPEFTPPSAPLQRCEQQSTPTVHAVPLAWHAPASGELPASGVPASLPWGVTWQTEPPVSVGRQLVPAQHSVELVQAVPTGVQLATVQTSFPLGPGTHGAPPQH